MRRGIPVSALLWLYPALAWGVTAHDIQRWVGIDPHIGREVPLTSSFRDEDGNVRSLGDVLGGRPGIVAMVYFDCPNLCTMTLNGLASSVQKLGTRRPQIDYRVIAISIDPREGPAQATAKRGEVHARMAGDPACRGCDSGWHFLTGGEASLRAVSSALGYRYFWDAGQAQYAHPAGVVVLSGGGRIVQYFNGLEFSPRELGQALTLAAEGRTGSLADRLWLLCYHYEALAGRYSGEIYMLLRILGLATIAGLALLLFRLLRVRA